MIENLKAFVQKHKTKSMLAVSVAAASTVPMTLAAAADDTNLDGVITNPGQTIDMWATITGGVTTFISGILVPVANFCTSNGICLAFLTVTFVSLGVRILRKSIGAFGRGI